jgi:hypothetical protein
VAHATGTLDSFFGGLKATERDVDNVSLSSVKLENNWRYTSTPHTSSWHRAYLNAAKTFIVKLREVRPFLGLDTPAIWNKVQAQTSSER